MEARCPLYPVAGELFPALPEFTCHTVCWLGLETFTEASAPTTPPLPRGLSKQVKGHLFFSSSRSVIGFAQAGAGFQQ